ISPPTDHESSARHGTFAFPYGHTTPRPSGGIQEEWPVSAQPETPAAPYRLPKAPCGRTTTLRPGQAADPGTPHAAWQATNTQARPGRRRTACAPAHSVPAAECARQGECAPVGGMRKGAARSEDRRRLS